VIQEAADAAPNGSIVLGANGAAAHIRSYKALDNETPKVCGSAAPDRVRNRSTISPEI
jgi:hypothetical protein